MKWSEHRIAAALARQTFQRKAVVITPNCNWTGYECDLLIVEQHLRIIDVEIKISRADLKADAKKDKWWIRQWGHWHPATQSYQAPPPTPRPWPPKVWKHYYAVPEEIWDAKLLDALPSPNSGVIGLREGRGGNIEAVVIRRSTPCRDATVLTAAEAVNIARLANLRLWDAYANADRLQADLVAARSTEVAASE